MLLLCATLFPRMTNSGWPNLLQGQYVKWVAPGGPADLNGMLTGDHIIEVDEVNVLELTHHEVITFMHLHSITLWYIIYFSDKASRTLLSKTSCMHSQWLYPGLPRLNFMHTLTSSPGHAQFFNDACIIEKLGVAQGWGQHTSHINIEKYGKTWVWGNKLIVSALTCEIWRL